MSSFVCLTDNIRFAWLCILLQPATGFALTILFCCFYFLPVVVLFVSLRRCEIRFVNSSGLNILCVCIRATLNQPVFQVVFSQVESQVFSKQFSSCGCFRK